MSRARRLLASRSSSLCSGCSAACLSSSFRRGQSKRNAKVGPSSGSSSEAGPLLLATRLRLSATNSASLANDARKDARSSHATSSFEFRCANAELNSRTSHLTPNAAANSRRQCPRTAAASSSSSWNSCARRRETRGASLLERDEVVLRLVVTIDPWPRPRAGGARPLFLNRLPPACSADSSRQYACGASVL